ncbi:hypothetical protein [Roseicyclus sp.]|uniref:hypothetical protein n=1 Tax=Roseicyclus sp. TaxID=1914329 RepID=UPI003F9EDB94
MSHPLSLDRLVRLMDRLAMPETRDLTLSPVCLRIEGEVGSAGMTEEEARAIMAEIDAKSSALLAVLAIILATSAFIFALDRTWATLGLMFGQIVTISVSILFLLRCLIYEPVPRLRRAFLLDEAPGAHHLQVEAIKQVLYFNRVILLTILTCALFFAMSVIVGVAAMTAPDT